MPAFVGLDLATHDWGLVAITGEDTRHLDIGNPQRKAKARTLAERLALIQRDVIVALETLSASGIPFVVGAEALPTRAAFSIGMLGEVHGAVRVEVWKRFGVEFEEVPLASARKFVMAENMPRAEGAKVVIRNAVKGVDGWSGVPGWSHAGPDAIDAFVVAAYLAGKAGFLERNEWRPRRIAAGDGSGGSPAGVGAPARVPAKPRLEGASGARRRPASG